jgi:di- and tripeptidase/Cys-Gly metallodipeptidase DUG1
VSDNKGPTLAFVYAVKELLAEGGPLPVNVAFVVEGEEENGSGGFREAVSDNIQWFDGTAAVIISNTLWVGERVPCLTYGMRGMISATLEVAGPGRDLHSGNDGGVISEPLVDLAKILATLHTPDGRIAVPGLTAGVRPGLLDDGALARLAASSEFSLGAYASSLGGASLLPPNTTPADLLRRRWTEPALSVCDVRVGDDAAAAGGDDPHYRFGPTRSSVIPRSAAAAVSLRFVPDQDADVLVAALRAHIERAAAGLSPANKASLRVKSVGHWWEADPASPAFTAAAAAIEGEWGTPPLLVREGGTMPVARALERMLGAPAVLVPFGAASDACHLANERVGRSNLRRGKNVVRELLRGLPAALAAAKEKEKQGGGAAPAAPADGAAAPAPPARRGRRK